VFFVAWIAAHPVVTPFVCCLGRKINQKAILHYLYIVYAVVAFRAFATRHEQDFKSPQSV